VFLDDTQNESDIRFQFNRAVDLARRSGSIAIGHPHPTTVRVLQQMLLQPACGYHPGSRGKPAE
jgi:polysaccharide deacetylase 2 family uncharacterized protein YibQ